jgi:UDP-N-acetylmuramate dehydrogenase
VDWQDFVVRKDISLAPFTTWKVGGVAQWYAEPAAEELPGLLRLARENGVPVFFLGRGSNILIADEGLPGLVIHTWKVLSGIRRIGEDMVEAEAGVPLPRLSRFVADLGCAGFEFLIGIPGTVGGGVVINAGLRAPLRREVSDILAEVDIVEADGKTISLSASEIGLRYRHSNLLDRGCFVLRARFLLQDFASGSDVIRRRTGHHLLERKQNQPLSRQTAGSTFKQVRAGPATGWYLEQAGLKGHRVGGAVVSEKHANWIETDVTATATDVKELMKVMVNEVQAKFGVVIQREVRFLPEDVSFQA